MFCKGQSSQGQGARSARVAIEDDTTTAHQVSPRRHGVATERSDGGAGARWLRGKHIPDNSVRVVSSRAPVADLGTTARKRLGGGAAMGSGMMTEVLPWVSRARRRRRSRCQFVEGCVLYGVRREIERLTADLTGVA